MTDKPRPPINDAEFMFRIGMVLGQMYAPPPAPTIPALSPGQQQFHVWSAPDWDGTRYLLTFRLVEGER